jgi:aerobic carbon-monoxide dehydrogenase small subunit
MLVTARDIVLRLPTPTRRASAGTGRQPVPLHRLRRHRARHQRAAAQPLTARDPAQSPDQATAEAVQPRVSAYASQASRRAGSHAAPHGPQTILHQSFTVDGPRDEVWRFFGRLDEVTTCLPGATVIGAATEDHVEVRIRMKVGPMTPEFEGAADVSRNPEDYSAVIHGAARDRRSSSATRGSIRYVLCEAAGGAATRVDIEVGYTLTGPLAQFGRSGLVEEIANRMTAAFAQNLQTRLADTRAGLRVEAPREAPRLDAGSLLLSIIGTRVRAFLRRLLRR